MAPIPRRTMASPPTPRPLLLASKQETFQPHLDHMSIYQRLGGDAAVTALIESLYVRALADPLISPFIENIDVPRLKAHQFAFISQAIGGPHPYPGPSLVQAHARLPIEQRHFDAFVAHLQGALQELESRQSKASLTALGDLCHQLPAKLPAASVRPLMIAALAD